MWIVCCWQLIASNTREHPASSWHTWLYSQIRCWHNLKVTLPSVATDLCLSWPKGLNLVTVGGFMKTPV